MAEGQITTTGIDALVEYLNAHGETDESKLAAELKVSEKVIEDWSSVLEKASVVKIAYKVGKMYVAPLSVSKEDVATYKNTIDTKKLSVETELVSEMNMLQEMDKRIANISKVVAGADLSFKKNAGQLKSDLDELERIEKESEKHYNGIKLEKERIDKISETLGVQMQALEEIAGKIQGFNAGEGDVKNILNDVKEKMKRYEMVANDFSKGFDKLVKEKRDEITKVHEETRAEMKLLQEALERQGRQLGENDRLSKYAKHESARLKGDAEKDKMTILNNLGKAKGEINNAFPLAEKKLREITAKIDELKKSFGDLSSMNAQIGNLKTEIENLRKEQQELFKTAEGIRGEVKALEYSKKSDVERSVDIKKIGEKISKLKEGAVALDDKVKKSKGDVDSFAAGGENSGAV